MADKQTYFELLKHPKWQQKRLQVLERAGFKCEECGDAEKTLHVHHGYYAKGLKPWEYPDASLFALCEDCHLGAQYLLSQLHEVIGLLVPRELSLVRGFVAGVLSQRDPQAPLEIGDWATRTIADGLGRCYGLTADEAYSVCRSQAADGLVREIGKALSEMAGLKNPS